MKIPVPSRSRLQTFLEVCPDYVRIAAATRTSGPDRGRLRLQPRESVDPRLCAATDRLILDARPRNALEEPVERWIGSLASGEALCGTVLPEGQVLKSSSHDLRDFYLHCWKIPCCQEHLRWRGPDPRSESNGSPDCGVGARTCTAPSLPLLWGTSKQLP